MNGDPGTVAETVTGMRPIVCVIGTFRSVDLTHESLIRNVVEPLDADLMFCVTRLSEQDEAFLDFFRDCNIVDACLYGDGKDGYEDLCVHRANRLGVEDPYAWRQYLEIGGNWLGGMQGRKGSGMHLTYNLWKLQERLNSLRKQGFRYQRFVVTRTDLLWLGEHPPLELLNPRVAWVPSGEDYGGYNDRHAVCSEKNIHHYLSLFDCMMSLRGRDYLNYVHQRNGSLNHERHLKCHLDYFGVGVGRFANLAYITGNQTSLTNRASVKYESIRGKRHAYKYKAELLSALKNQESLKGRREYDRIVLNVSFWSEFLRLWKERIKYRHSYVWEGFRKFKHRVLRRPPRSVSGSMD